METSIKANKTQGISVTELGAQFSESVTIEDWEHFGEQIGRMVNSSQFIIGDWLNFGRNRWENRKEYAERISFAETKTGLDPISLKCYASVARKIPLENRNSDCSFTHHIAVAKLDAEEQSKWLDIAKENSISTRILKASIKVGKLVNSSDLKSKGKNQVHTYDDCIAFVHDIFRWYSRKKNSGFFDNMTAEQLAFQRDKLKPAAEIYNELNALIRRKQD